MYKYIDYYNEKKYSNLTTKAYEILEEGIVTLELKPGQTYSEAELSTFSGIGRTPVREALKKLELATLVEIIPRHGINIAKVRLEDCALQMEVRNILEKLVIMRATKFSTPSEREQFLKLATEYDKATTAMDALSSIRIDYEFNLFAGDCARNIFAKTALMPLQPLARRLYYMQYHFNVDITREINAAHSDLMKQIASGNEQLSLQALEALFKNIKLLSTSNVLII
ncbi:hypothetical protein AN639_09950 [Candidatus Epulonipiscium fishelsonii]|uniref:Uncharacterized protein n=1 Tax=Candidatus Epulonipiscium fishelsonii TaxID=77094 RepID=A0ACC8X8D2_9FIRM|nr:hypothetical protein AN396_11875 [Epulopiscium sp. SCG-B11WGA-EpuloA1]ONI43827.1 hypothetical protein AN639_09950 [Epulopiscium sp. SCG-B05WGA-EpuloA1]